MTHCYNWEVFWILAAAVDALNDIDAAGYFHLVSYQLEDRPLVVDFHQLSS